MCHEWPPRNTGVPGVECTADTETRAGLYSGQFMILTSRRPLLTVIKQPVIRRGTHCCSENDSSESCGQHSKQ